MLARVPACALSASETFGPSRKRVVCVRLDELSKSSEEREVKGRITRRAMRLGLLALLGTMLVTTGGCPIDTDTVITETVGAALNAIVTSLVDSLSQHLAGT